LRLATSELQGTAISEAVNRRERLSNELRDVELKLQSTSDDPRVLELLSESKNLNQRLGVVQAELVAAEGAIQRLQADRAVRQRQIEDRIEKRRVTSRAKHDVKLAQAARKVLDSFVLRLAPEKLSILKEHINDMYRRLLKAEDPVCEIDIDTDTWQIRLSGEDGRVLEKRVFSAGMKEMYALSLLWALSKASGKELPIVIDTPVGRLDTTNRRALFERYLPVAGHQVIVLSTDTEVDVEWASRLEPFIARQYRLDHDTTTGSTVIRPGYFA
jgi:DNA sulfur modification protein DndD